MNKLTFPTVHLNGSGRSFLSNSFGEARAAVEKAVRAVEESRPTARDYYTQEDQRAFTTALEQHRDRLRKLAEVSEELNALQEHVAS
jgi:BMFP domain-containing protein YqiC